MRLVWLLALLPTAAAASPWDPYTDVIVQPPRHATRQTPGFAQVSHVIYLNDCLPNGCTITPGFDDSRSDHSSIPQQQSHIAGWSWGPDLWNQFVQCVKDTYAPFDLQIVTTDPGTAPHFELMVGGNSTDIGIQGAGGVAPFIPCDGQLQDNVISFVFSAETNNLYFLCGAAAQETSHVFGLDHELNALDPMTYLDLGSHKVFQNALADCGEYQPRDCRCGGSQQNSVQYLNDTFGPAQLDPPSLAIATPADGSWVTPGFAVRATAISQLSTQTGALAIDGAQTSTAMEPAPLVFNAPNDLAGGDHVVTVTATDSGARIFSASVTVHVTASCVTGSCDSGFSCLGGHCLPGADVAGGLGATCTDNVSCITGACGTDGNQHLCTGPCDPGNSCPSGFVCLASGDTGVCWPGSNDGGGCSSSGAAPQLLLVGWALAVVVIRRRRA
jgi:hypothetical protein